jgi:hypothetical protein
MLGSEPPESLDRIIVSGQPGEEAEGGASALSLVLRADYLFRHGCMEDAFRVAGQVRSRGVPLNMSSSRLYCG